MKELIQYNDEVTWALSQKKPIVALESTIISHGMPYPENIETARKVSEIVRENGAIPATIAIIDGNIRVGLSSDELQFLATSENISKSSIRDLAFITCNHASASTTVAATAQIAHLAGISFFATGGIGGVHLDFSNAFDVSADLYALFNTPICIIASGAKSILDLEKTLELLETLSIPVLGYQTNALPAFYSRNSPHQLTMRANSPEDIARLCLRQQALQLTQAILICNPVPEQNELPYELIEPIIKQATAEASGEVLGKALTPFLLKRVNELTNGESLKTNIALIKNNAKLAANCAVSYHQHR